MNMDKILNFIDENEKACKAVVVVVLALSIDVLGYGIGVGEQATRSTSALLESTPRTSKQVLGERVAPFYVNPFDEVDLQKVGFPVEQLRGCRNYSECRELCSKPANFQSCVAWSNSVE